MTPTRRFAFRFESRAHRQALVTCAHGLGVLVRLTARRDGTYDVVAEGPEAALASLALYPRYTDGVVAVDPLEPASLLLATGTAVDSPPSKIAIFGALLGVLV